jgi:multiple sugar transport system substrate-binding protein
MTSNESLSSDARRRAEAAASRQAALTRRGLLSLGGGLGLTAALAACGGGKTAGQAATGGGQSAQSTFSGKYDGPAVTLSYWNGFTGGDGPFMKKLVQQFQQENANIKVQENTIQWAEYYQRLPAAVTAGKGPDVGAMHLDQLATNAARNVIVPVDSVASALGLAEADFTPEVWQAGIYKDKRYGIPLDVHSLASYYNKDLLKAAGVADAPTDKASFQDTLDKLKAKGQDNPFWMPSRWPAHLMFLSLLWQNGGEPYASDGSKATFDSDQGVAALTWMVDQVKKGYSPPNVAIDSQYVAFKGKKTPLTWDGIWQINDVKSTGIPFELTFLPKIGDQQLSWANSHNFYITKQATADQNKFQASQVFVDWISKHSAEWAGAGMVPARKSIRETPAVQNSPQGPIAKQIQNLRFLPPVPGLGDVQAQTLEIAVANAVLGKQDPASALKDAAGKATKLMEANKAKFGS